MGIANSLGRTLRKAAIGTVGFVGKDIVLPVAKGTVDLGVGLVSDTTLDELVSKAKSRLSSPEGTRLAIVIGDETFVIKQFSFKASAGALKANIDRLRSYLKERIDVRYEGATIKFVRITDEQAKQLEAKDTVDSHEVNAIVEEIMAGVNIETGEIDALELDEYHEPSCEDINERFQS